MTKADKKDEERKEQLETEALMDAEVEAATDCGPVSHKAEKKDKEKAEQAETEALMDAARNNCSESADFEGFV